MIKDTPIHRCTFLEMTDDEQIAFIKQLREKRTEPISIYNEIMAEKKQAKLDKLNEKMDKAIKAFEKDLATFDKKLESLTKRANLLKQLKIEIDMES